MRPYDFAAARTVAEALGRGGDGSAYLAGGTTLVDLMKLDVMTPQHVVDINSLPTRGVRDDRHGLRVGALERMSDTAVHPLVTAGYPLLAQALLASASPQLRNMASIGGNLLQRSRCGYFRDTTMPCNKRAPGTGCPALHGENRLHAVLGGSDSCVSTHPSDLAVALVALDASVELQDRSGTRMKKALLSVCMGANSTAVAWAKHPDEFAEIQALILLQPLSGRSMGERFSTVMGFEGGYDRLDQACHEHTGPHPEEQSPLTYANAITVPTLVAQVHDDVMTRPEDVQAIYDAIPVADKKMDWIGGTDRRFDEQGGRQRIPGDYVQHGVEHHGRGRGELVEQTS